MEGQGARIAHHYLLQMVLAIMADPRPPQLANCKKNINECRRRTKYLLPSLVLAGNNEGTYDLVVTKTGALRVWPSVQICCDQKYNNSNLSSRYDSFEFISGFIGKYALDTAAQHVHSSINCAQSKANHQCSNWYYRILPAERLRKLANSVKRNQKRSGSFVFSD